ncbi:hypothetical protein GSI_07354 [Ganoderma sinense ZZ0214-1]|uniref:MYND-type domain-containing protein n=1 Tax=Ganoderma sinense ZZ0214-1 TaxID=1077348 RepID=A0A2G8SA69_9APHY|nr:hypothetical protein GSI_07354 [Ganoderma sinense ZZ0214-1]
MDPSTPGTSAEQAEDENSNIAEPLFDSDVCACCNLGPPRVETLKRFQGWKIVIYCGRECQAAAWPTHKAVCRSREAAQATQETEFSGYATQIALAQAVKEWCGLHQFTLMVLVHSLLRTAGGVEASLRLGRAVVFVLSPGRGESTLGNEDPGRAFTLRGAKVIEREHAQGFKTGRIPEEPADAGFWAQSAGTGRAGYLPVVCFMEDSTSVVTSRYPVFRAFHHPDDTPPGGQMAAVFRDLNRIFTNFVNNGAVLRPPVIGCTTIPYAGRMVRKRKGWMWQQDFGAWPYMDVVIPILSHVTSRETTLSATELWTRFWQW